MRHASSSSRALTRRTAIAIAVSQTLLAVSPAFAETATDIERRMAQRAMVQQAIYQLVAEGSDPDGDGSIEAPAMKASTQGTVDGGVIPDSSGAPKTDGYGGLLAYCSWDTGASKTSAGRLVGGDGAGAVSVAVLSYGLDNTFQTTCAQLAAGLGVQGDDFAFWMTANQLAANNSTNVSIYWGAPVSTLSVLQGIVGSALHDGEVRIVKDTNQLFRWNATTQSWGLLGEEPLKSWKESYESNLLVGSYSANKVSIGQTGLGPDMLTVNGKTFGALGLRGATAQVGTKIYDSTGSSVKAFLGFDHPNNKLVLSSDTGALSIQLGGSERMLVRADGSLALNGATVFDAQRNLAANAGNFTASVSAAGYQVGGVQVVDAGRNLVNIESLTTVGSASVGSLRVAGTEVINSARAATLSGLQVNGGTTVTGALNANGGVTTTGLVSSGQILGAPGSVTTPAFAFTGAGQTGMYSAGASSLGLTVSGTSVLNATTTGVNAPVGISVSGGNFVLSSAKTTGTLANRPVAGVANRLYVTTDTAEIYFDTGSTWKRISATDMAKLNDIALSSLASGQTLVYNAVTGKWTNATIGAGAGIAVTSSAGAVSIGLTNVGTAGTYGNTTQVPVLTTDAQGRVTAVNNVTVTPAWTSITGTPTTVAGYGITDINAYAPTLTGEGATGTWAINITGNAASANKVVNLGNVAAETLTTSPPTGMTMRQVYNNGYPTAYGNVLSMGGAGQGQLLLGWSGSSGAHADNYIRSKRDVADANWSNWAKIVTDVNVGSYAPSLTGVGASGTWGINVTGNAASASRLVSLRTLSMTGDGTWNTTFDGSSNSTGVFTLANSGVTAGTYNNSATEITPFTVDAKGRVTATGAAVTITPAWTSITGKPTTVAGYGITDINSYAPTLTGVGASGTWGISVTGNAATATKLATARTISATGDATWSTSFDGSGNATGVLTLANSGVAAGTYNNSSTSITPFTVDAKGRVTAAGAAVTITPAWTSITGKPTTVAGYGITDINSYAPTRTGVGASGTWGISVTGNAATASAIQVDDTRAVSDTPETVNQGVYFDFKSNTANGLNDGGTYNGVMTFRKWGTSTDWSGGAAHQLSFTDNGDLWHRSGTGTAWGGWQEILDSSNVGQYAPSLTGAGASGTWGINVTGNAATATKLSAARTLSATGDATWSTSFDGSGNATGVLTLANSGVAAGTYNNSSTSITPFTVDTKGRVTAAGAAVTITPAWTSITGKPTTVAGYGIMDINSYAPTLTGVGASGTWGISVTGNAATATKLATARTISATGDATWSTSFDGSGNATGVLTLANSGVTAGTYGSATTAPVYTVDAKGRVTAASNVTITPAWSNITGKPTTIAGYGITDVNSYAPTLTGGGASGTWGINITGNAATASTILGFTNSNSANPVSADGMTQNGIAYVNSGIALFGQTDGALFTQAYSSAWVGQIYQDYRTGQIALRGKNNGTWTGWRTVLDSANAPYAAAMNQNVRTTDAPTFAELYSNGWFRNNQAGQGMYNQATARHFYSESAAYWRASSDSGMKFYAGDNATLRGYIYHDVNGFGVVNNAGGWSIRANHGSGMGGQLYGTWEAGNLTVGGQQVIHAGNIGSYAMPKNGGVNADFDIASSSNSSSYGSAAIELRELNHGGAQTGALSEAPRLSFNWGGRVASQIAMNTDGTVMIRDNPGTGYEKFAAGNITANGALTATGNLTLTAANPYIYSGGSYIVVPNGAHFSGGSVYVQNQLQARGGVNNDSGNLTLSAAGGTIVNSNQMQLAAVASNGAACGVAGAIARDASNNVYICK